VASSGVRLGADPWRAAALGNSSQTPAVRSAGECIQTRATHLVGPPRNNSAVPDPDVFEDVPPAILSVGGTGKMDTPVHLRHIEDHLCAIGRGPPHPNPGGPCATNISRNARKLRGRIQSSDSGSKICRTMSRFFPHSPSVPKANGGGRRRIKKVYEMFTTAPNFEVGG